MYQLIITFSPSRWLATITSTYWTVKANVYFKIQLAFAVARIRKSFYYKLNKRDTGEIFHDLSVPIYVNGQHWGAIRMGYKAESAH